MNIELWSDITNAFDLDQPFTLNEARQAIRPNVQINNHHRVYLQIKAELERAAKTSGDARLLEPSTRLRNEVWVLPSLANH